MSIAQAETVLDKIRTRGFWRVVIRPSSFEKNHIPNYADLFPIIQKNSVRLRGWDYPHIDRQNPPRNDNDSVGQEYAWDTHLEVWRFFKSGLFVHYFAIFGEWRDQSKLWPADPEWKEGRDFGYVSAVYSLVEIFEFAARLALSPAGAEIMRVDIDIHGLKGRTLASSDQTILLWGEHRTDTSEWNYFREYSRTDLIARPRELAAEAARDLFARFGLNISPEVVTRIQERIGR